MLAMSEDDGEPRALAHAHEDAAACEDASDTMWLEAGALRFGVGTPVDVKSAVRCLAQAAEAGNDDALSNLGITCSHGALQSAARRGCCHAQCALADFYFDHDYFFKAVALWQCVIAPSIVTPQAAADESIAAPVDRGFVASSDDISVEPCNAACCMHRFVARTQLPALPIRRSREERPLRVAIIGAGPSGLIVLKECLAKGFECIVFEKGTRAGGAFSVAYEGAQLTSSSVITAFGCFPDGREASPGFWSAEEYVQYLHRFAEAFGLDEHIRYGTTVDAVRRDSGRWIVDTTHDGISDTHTVDALAVCSGLHQTPAWPDWAAPFTTASGASPCRVLHSSQFERAAGFAGQRVLIVGLGESGSDLSLAVARHAASVTVSVRGNGPGTVVGRWAADGEPADLQTSRANMRAADAWGPKEYTWLWSAVLASEPGSAREAALVRTALGGARSPQTFSPLERDAMAWNLKHKNLPFHRFGTKNFAFLEAVRSHGAEIVGEVRTMHADGTVAFADGALRSFDVIICCTGYTSSFPFFEAHLPDVAARAVDARARFKHVLCPDAGPRLAFIGFARPAFGAVPPMSELAARYWAALLAGDITLPADADLRATIARDRAAERALFPRDAARLTALCQYSTYLDDLAGLLGCKPRLALLRANHAHIWRRVLHSTLCGAQFRLHGPGASEEAWRAMSRMPLPRMRRQPRCAVAAKAKALAADDMLSDPRARSWLWANLPAIDPPQPEAVPSTGVVLGALSRGASPSTLKWLDPVAVAADAPAEELAAAIMRSCGVLRLCGIARDAPYAATGRLLEALQASPVPLGGGGRLDRGLSFKGRWPWTGEPAPLADHKRVLDCAFEHAAVGDEERLADLPPTLAALAAAPFAFLDGIVEHVLPSVHAALALATGCDAVRAERPSVKYRLSDYAAHPAPSDEQPHPLRCAEHRDYGSLAIIFDGGVEGLEVLVDGVWRAVPPSADDALLMMGWATHIRSNGRVFAPTHRVRDLAGDDDVVPRRISLVAFTAPPPTARLAPALREGEKAKFRGSIAGGAHAQAMRAHRMV